MTFPSFSKIGRRIKRSDWLVCLWRAMFAIMTSWRLRGKDLRVNSQLWFFNGLSLGISVGDVNVQVGK